MYYFLNTAALCFEEFMTERICVYNLYKNHCIKHMYVYTLYNSFKFILTKLIIVGCY